MKRLLVLTGMICMLFSMAVFAEETSGDYKYTLLEDGTAEITAYTGEDTELEVPSSLDGYAVTSIGENAFYVLYSLSSVTLPEGLTNIGANAFFCCGNLNSITLPESLKSIGDQAFNGCSSLSSITLPDSIERVGNNPFFLDNVTFTISPDHPYLSVTDGVLFSKPDKRLIYFPVTREEYVVPEGILSIGGCAFCDCMNLSSITLPEGLTTIEEKAFADCDNLSSITLPEGLTSIGKLAFADCDNLSSIELPEGLASIGVRAFYNCPSLNSVSLPESVTSIGEGAFSDCDSNLTVTVPRDSYAAEYCKENGINCMYSD